MDLNDVTGEAGKEIGGGGDELFVLPLKVRGVFSGQPGALLSVSKRKKEGKEENNFRPLLQSSMPRLSFPLIVLLLQSGMAAASARRRNRPFVSLGQIGWLLCLLGR